MLYEKALEFMKNAYYMSLGNNDSVYLEKYQDIALILKELDYDTEHFVTALFMNILDETDTKPSEVLRYSSMQVMEAIRILRETDDCQKLRHLMDTHQNELAFPVRMAERLYMLMNIKYMARNKRKQLICEIEQCLECASGTLFHEPMSMKLDECRNMAGVY